MNVREHNVICVITTRSKFCPFKTDNKHNTLLDVNIPIVKLCNQTENEKILLTNLGMSKLGFSKFTYLYSTCCAQCILNMTVHAMCNIVN